MRSQANIIILIYSSILMRLIMQENLSLVVCQGSDKQIGP